MVAQLPAGNTLELVTHAFHLPRAVRLFEPQGLKVIRYRWISRLAALGPVTPWPIPSTISPPPMASSAAAAPCAKPWAARFIVPGENHFVV